MGYYRVAQICINGHVINSSADAYPEMNQKFCKECGQHTITNCPECNQSIRGVYYESGWYGGSIYSAPAFCHNCGHPFPWTAAKLEAAKILIDEDDQLGLDEKGILSSSLSDLIVDTPRTQLAISRFKKITYKALSITGEGLKSILIEICSEAVKKALWP
jgi:Uncharacterized protein conserved in bacteria